MTTAAHPDDGDADLVRRARELIAKVRTNGHDVSLHGCVAFLLNVSKPSVPAPLVQNRGLPSFAVGVDLTPFEDLFAMPRLKRDLIFRAALEEEA